MGGDRPSGFLFFGEVMLDPLGRVYKNLRRDAVKELLDTLAFRTAMKDTDVEIARGVRRPS